MRQGRQQQPDGTWSKADAEMPYPISIAMDMEGIEVGWMSFANGPAFQMVKLGDAKPQRPTPYHNDGTRNRVYNQAPALRQSSTSETVVKQPMTTHPAY